MPYSFFLHNFMRESGQYPPSLDVDFKAPSDLDQTPDTDQQPEEFEVTDLTEVRQTPPPLPNRARGRERQTPPPIPEAAKSRGVHTQPEDKVLFDDTEFSGQTQPKSLKQLAKEGLHTPPPIPDAARFRRVDAQPYNFESQPQRNIKEIADEVISAEAQERESAKTVQKIQQKALEIIGKAKLAPELQVAMLKRVANGIDLRDGIPTEREIWQMVKDAAAPMAAEQRRALENLGLTFDQDNTLVLDEIGKSALEHKGAKEALARLDALTELFAAPIARGEIKRREITNADRVYHALSKGGIDARTIQNALSPEFLDALEHTDIIEPGDQFIAGKSDAVNTSALLNTIDRTIRAFENRGQFTIDLYGDPQPTGPFNWLKNKLSFGRRADKQKSSHEYQNIVALQALRDSINIGPMPKNPIKYPAPESFADMAAATAPAKPKRPLSQGGRWAAGLAGITAVGTAASMYDESQARDHREAARASAATPAAETAQPEVQDGVYQFPEITVAPQKLASESAPRPRRERTDYTPARSAETEVTSQARSIDEALDLKTTKSRVRAEGPRRRTPKIDVFADHSSVRTAAEVAPAKAKKASKKEVTTAKAAKLVGAMIPKKALDNVLKKEIVTKRAQAATEVTASPIETAASNKGLMTQVESSLNTKFGADAERYLNALPKDVRAALSETTPAQARALLADKIINIHEDPNITAERITALHAAKEALKGM